MAIGAVRQVALSAGRDLDRTLAFWRDVLGLPLHARYDPPGVAYLMTQGVRLLFIDAVPAGTVYLDMPGLKPFCEAAIAAGVPFTAKPSMVHFDSKGEFGPAGEEEWMAFLKDPAGNTVGLVERLMPARGGEQFQ